MDWVWVLLLGGGIYLVIYLVNKNTKAKLMASGQIIERRNEFLEQVHMFTTRTASVTEIARAINQSVLAEQKVSFEPNYQGNTIVFRLSNLAGEFAAALRFAGSENGQYTYKFQFEHWRGKNGAFPDLFAGNALLTTIEKAFMQLDGATQVQRLAGQYKSKTKFF